MLDLIYNPSAGEHNGQKLKKSIALIESRLKERKIEYKFHCAEKKGQTTALTKELIEKGSTDLVIIGGDGTLHAAINGFHSFEKVNMGIIPCGTGNDFAYALNIPKDPVKAIDLIIDGTPKYTDFMQMPTVRGLNVIGMGLDVEVLKKYQKLKKKTKWGYTRCLLKALCGFKPMDFTSVINDKREKYNTFIVAVANGSVFGGGIPICPIADTADNKLDFVAVKGMSKLSLVFAFIKLKAGKILKLKQAIHKTTESIQVEINTPHTVNVDGELYEDIPFEIKVVSNKLKIYR